MPLPPARAVRSGSSPAPGCVPAFRASHLRSILSVASRGSARLQAKPVRPDGSRRHRRSHPPIPYRYNRYAPPRNRVLSAWHRYKTCHRHRSAFRPKAILPLPLASGTTTFRYGQHGISPGHCAPEHRHTSLPQPRHAPNRPSYRLPCKGRTAPRK